MQKGFGLVMILIVVALALLIGGGGFYIKNIKTQQTQIQVGIQAEKEAQDLKNKIEAQNPGVVPGPR